MWCFYYVSTDWTENSTRNQGTVPERRTKERNWDQEARTGTKNQGMIPEPRAKEQYRDQGPV